MNIIEKAKAQFLEMIHSFGSDPYRLIPHLNEAEKWAEFMLKKYPQADREIVMLSLWLHDIGHYPLPADADHAVRSEERAKKFLESQNYPKIKEVLHCVRSHRCKDVLPKTLEAKIISFVDSASHMTDYMYFDMVKDENAKTRVHAKMQRDFRDLQQFPEIKENLTELYHAWENLINTYEKFTSDTFSLP